jgi:dTDP-4-dehydrorhamnose 3,5-epimerase
VKFNPTDLPGVFLIEPDVHRDDRGFFLETHQQERYAAGGVDARFVQDNHSRSGRGTLRGLHAQLKRPQGKLVRVIEGEVFDVAVDIRRGSPHFGRFASALLSAENFHQFYVPPGFAHGFCVTSEVAQFEYKCTDFYDPTDEIAIAWNDPVIGIPWPLTDPLLSAKDSAAPSLAETELLPTFEDR